MSDPRTLHADGLFNGRDLGGLPLRDGGYTPARRVFRSENVDRVTDDGWQALREAGIRTVVDLRAPSEIAKDTGARPDWLSTVVIDHDGLDDAPTFWADYWETGLVGTPLYYGPHLDELPERTGSVLREIAQTGPGGVLFHCAGGRDRTGIVALALLTIADVEPDAIVADYLVTVENAPALLASIGVPSNEAAIEELCAEYGTTVEGAFRAALDGFDVDRFVQRSGLSAVELEALRMFRADVA